MIIINESFLVKDFEHVLLIIFIHQQVIDKLNKAIKSI